MDLGEAEVNRRPRPSGDARRELDPLENCTSSESTGGTDA